MTLANVLARVKVWTPPLPVVVDYGRAVVAATTQFRSDVEDAVSLLYGRSATAREILDAGAAKGDIWVYQLSTGGSGAFPSTNSVAIDPTQARNIARRAD